MALMIAQMENQDPTQPMDQLAFMSQLAQFGTVSCSGAESGFW